MISGGNESTSGNGVAKRTTEDFEQSILDYSFDNTNLTASVPGIKETVNKDDVTEITIPSVIKNDGKEYQVKSVNCRRFTTDTDFKKCKNLHTIIISEGVEKLSEYVFNQCENLKKVILPNTLEEIPEQAFAYDKSLEKINIPNSIIKIDEAAFRDCEKLKEIVLPDGLEEIKRWAFDRVYSALKK